MRLRRVARLCLLGLLAAAASAAAGAEARLEGRANYGERIALPPGAVFEAVLEDLSAADATAVEIARTEIADPGNPPFEFAIDYDPARLAPGHRYGIRARVTVGGRLVFLSDAAHPVLADGAADTAQAKPQITMRMVGGPQVAGAAAPAIGAHGLRLPATFTGALPCGDCTALRWRLNLWPDQVFHQRRAWQGKDFREDRIGRWSVDARRGVLVLADGEEETRFDILGPSRLRLLGPDGAPVAAGPGHELAARDVFEPMEVHLPLRGMVTFMAETARFTECLTGRDYPVAPEGDYAALEHAYLAAGAEPGGPLMASVEGGIVEWPTPDGAATEPTVVVDRFVGVWPGEACARAQADATLTDTYWRILRLGTAEIAAGDGREPHLLLRSGEAQFDATVGCNRMSGSFTLAGEALSFGPAASTRMGCAPPLDDWERRLGQVLGAARGWRLDGQALELFDADGAPLALFQAVYLP